jgi:hypothetical protein
MSYIEIDALHPALKQVFVSRTMSWRVNASALLIVRVIGLITITIAVLIWRRPDQAFHPSLWSEEGPEVLLSYAECGLCALWRTVNGHVLLIPKLLLLSSFKLSINNAPVIAYALSLATICGTVICIAEAPTHLRAKYLCAIATLLIPTGPENYGVALYTLWWAGLLVLLALLWDTQRGYGAFRVVLLIVGGLSSPLMILMGPLFVARAFLERTRNEAGIAVLACGLSTGGFIAASFSMTAKHLPAVSAEWVTAGIAKFFGTYTIFGTISPVASGFVLLALLAFLVAASRQQMDMYFGLLLCALVFSVLSSMIRAFMIGASIDSLEPFGSGQRYFFYVFILLSFALLWLAAVTKPRLLQLAPSLILASALLLSLRAQYFVWPEVWVPSGDWRSELVDCAAKVSRSKLTVTSNEHLLLYANQCRSLLEDSLMK